MAHGGSLGIVPAPADAVVLNRRDVLVGGAAFALSPGAARATQPEPNDSSSAGTNIELVDVGMKVNGADVRLRLDPRTTLLDALREHLTLTGTKKGCDHGQCGACTTIVNGRRINSCLTLAVMHAGDAVTTIEGLSRNGSLHPMQAAFVERDAFQCGYCTPGQICSSIAMLEELRAGMPSHVTADLTAPAPSRAEFQERMSGNICRCGAYSNIIAAISDVSGVRT
jgi:xanthine dehydrogenase YagT iron-sulfur-binding subunit